MYYWEDAPGKTLDTLERLCLLFGLGLEVLTDELEDMAVKRGVWASLATRSNYLKLHYHKV